VIDARLALAADSGLALPEAGKIAVFLPPAGAYLDTLDPARLEIIEGFKPRHDNWTARGFACRVTPGEGYAAAIVCLPRAKVEGRALVATAMTLTDGPIIIDGQKTDGVDSLIKDLRSRVPLSAPISKAHGKLVVCTEPSPEAVAYWLAGPSLTAGGFWTAPGVFSADGIDPGSALLADALPQHLGRRVGDFGAGWGYLSAHVLTRPEVEAVHLVEAEHMALECARRNVTDPRAQFHWADAATWCAPAPLDAVVMNPPFHTARAADPALGAAFIAAAAANLAPQGHLWMVANRHLPYERALGEAFATISEIGGDSRFKVFHATKPRRASRR
jgi:16S rRNA (guanine1207-N2)-methyltransferase